MGIGQEQKLKAMAEKGLLVPRGDGSFETVDERDKRLAHNQRMRFNRSFQSCLMKHAVLVRSKLS